MEYVNLGKAGVKVSRVCLGCMTYGRPPAGQPRRPGSHNLALREEESQPFFKQALDLGINFWDTANVYGNGESERVVGRFLKANAKREDVVLATKVNGVMRDGPNGGGLSRKEIFFELDESLKRLQTDYVDLYWIHRWDKTVPIEEVLETLNDVVRAGKVLYLGASSMYAWQFQRMLHVADQMGLARFVTMQNHYNLVYREEEREMIPLCLEEGVGLIPWSPLARGFVMGNRTRGGKGETIRAKTDDFAQGLYYRDSDFTVVERITEVAKQRGVSNAQVALAWMLDKPGITSPIIGASKMAHLEDLLGALDVHLSEEEVARLEEPYEPHPVLGHK